MCDYMNDFIASTGSRDKVMAIVQFLPMALAGPVDSMGSPALARSLCNLSRMADSYRAVTRLGLLFGAVSKNTIKSLKDQKCHDPSNCLARTAHVFHVLFCIFENNAVLASHGVTAGKLARLGGCAVTCWFYVLLSNIMRELYILTHKPMKDEEKKSHIFALIKFTCFIIFAKASVPKAGPELLEQPSGLLMPVHSLLRMICPSKLDLTDSTRGLLGLIASICDFY